MYNVLIGIFATVFVVSAGYLGYYFINSNAQSDRYSELAGLRSVTEDSLPSSTGETVDPNALVEVVDPETGESVWMLPTFAQLYILNNDVVGWINIPGTGIDYPVMQNQEKQDFYLNHNFDKEYSSWGCLYTWPVCDVAAPSDNITIYGHHMRDGPMFAALDNYTEKSFWEQYPYIYFDTLTLRQTYQIISVFKTTASVGEGFAYHEYVDMNETQFEEFISACNSLSLYDTGVEAEFGDKFITLSTCEYSQTNGRLVVVAKRIA